MGILRSVFAKSAPIGDTWTEVAEIRALSNNKSCSFRQGAAHSATSVGRIRDHETR